MPFQYEQYRDPYIQTIGELMRAGPAARAQAALQSGNAQAQAALQSGNAWAGAIQNVGQAIAGIPAQIAQQRQQQQFATERDLQIQQMKRQATQADRLDATKKQVNSLMQDPSVLNADGTFNLQSMIGKMGTAPAGMVGPQEPPDVQALTSLIEPLNQHITQARQAKLEYETQQRNAIAKLASNVLTLGQQNGGNYVPYGQAAVAAAQKSGLLTEAQASQFLAQLVEDPQRALQGAMALSTAKPIELGEKDLVDPITGRVIVAGRPKDEPDYTINGVRFSGKTHQPYGPAVPPQVTPTPKSYQKFSVLLDGKPAEVLMDPSPGGKIYDLNQQPIDNAATRIRPMPPASVTINQQRDAAAAALGKNMPSWALDDSRPSGPDANKFDPTIQRTPNGLYQDAVTLIQEGRYPPSGRGNDPKAQALRAAIDGKVGAIAASAGLDVPSLRAFYKANQASLTQLQKVADMAAANMQTADRNADLLEVALGKMPDTGSPLLNQPLRAFQTRVAGDPAMGPIATYLASVQNEYGKIISSSTSGASPLTDSARHEAQALLDPNATVAQIIGSIRALKAEGGNRLVSTGEQIQTILGRTRIGGGGPGGTPAPVAAPATITVIDPTGKPHVFATQAQADVFKRAAGLP